MENTAPGIKSGFFKRDLPAKGGKAGGGGLSASFNVTPTTTRFHPRDLPRIRDKTEERGGGERVMSFTDSLISRVINRGRAPSIKGP